MKDFEYQVIDAFEGNNVIKGHLQRLTAYLTLSTLEIEASLRSISYFLKVKQLPI